MRSHKISLKYTVKGSQDFEEDTVNIILGRLDRVDAAMEGGGSNRLARQINRLQLPLEDLDVDSMTQYRLEKLDATLKNIAEGLSR